MSVEERPKTITVMAKNHDHLRTLAKEVAPKALADIKEGFFLEGLFEKVIRYIKALNRRCHSLKDGVVATSDQHFERVKEHVAFFYLNLDLN